MNNSDLLFLANFIEENTKSGGLSKDISNQIEILWNEYKLPVVINDCSIICADFGNLGSLVIRHVKSVEEEKELKYESGSYDYIHIQSDSTRRILWTDYKDTEPYNRNSGLYCDGASFKMLGEPVKTLPEYREFDVTHSYLNNICFGVWGYHYNDFYNCVTFGLAIETNKVNEFIEKLRKLINK